MSVAAPTVVVHPFDRPSMTEIASSMASHIGYDDAQQMLYVQMKPSKRDPDAPGPLYRYPTVTQSEFDRLQYGESVGTFVNVTLKKDRGVIAERVVDTDEF